MKAVISNFYIYKTHFLTKTLPVILIFFTSCSYYYRNNVKIHSNDNEISRTEVVKRANSLLGSKYKYGGTSFKEGFDCSGFTRYVYKKVNIILPHSSKAQSKLGKKINIKDVKSGDLVFFKHRGKINHVGIVEFSSNKHLIVIHSTTSEGVKKDDIMNSEYWKKRLTFARDVISK